MTIKHKAFVLSICCFGVFATAFGCAALQRNLTASSAPVLLNIANTNTPAYSGYIDLAKYANAAFNPTPSEPAINYALSGMESLLAAFFGFYARHKVGTTSVTTDNSSQTKTTT